MLLATACPSLGPRDALEKRVEPAQRPRTSIIPPLPVVHTPRPQQTSAPRLELAAHCILGARPPAPAPAPPRDAVLACPPRPELGATATVPRRCAARRGARLPPPPDRSAPDRLCRNLKRPPVQCPPACYHSSAPRISLQFNRSHNLASLLPHARRKKGLVSPRRHRAPTTHSLSSRMDQE